MIADHQATETLAVINLRLLIFIFFFSLIYCALLGYPGGANQGMAEERYDRGASASSGGPRYYR
jgi:hypothetical protein